MTDDLRPSDENSALVERSWVRRTKRGGELTERPMTGQEVEATFLDPHGGLHHVAGTVARGATGGLVVRSWADRMLKETAVPRDASVSRVRRSEGRQP
jgi:hypothetical protein